MGTAGISGLTSQLTDYLSKLQEKQQRPLSANDLASDTDMASTLLSAIQTDFVDISDTGYAKSQEIIGINSLGETTASDLSYLDAYKAGSSAKLTLQNTMASSLKSAMKSTMDKVNDAAFWNSPGMRTAMMLRTLGSSFQEILEDLQKMVDEQIAKAQEAAAANEEGTANAAAESTSTDTAQSQVAAPQSAAATSAESVTSDTAQSEDAVMVPDADSQIAEAAFSMAEESGGSGGGTSAVEAPSSISITV